uniref:Uncharacterized protein n=1 Tax=Oryza nivara TaxID=4536 RepID=A0A0E0IV13_ORYNI
MAMPWRIPTARAARRWRASAAAVGCAPAERRDWARWRRDPARTTTVVVPSPAAASWERERSASMRAAGWRRGMRERMVAPSLELEEIILSMPRGPREVRAAAVTARPAAMLRLRTSSRRLLSVSVLRDCAGEAATAAAMAAAKVLVN